MVSRVNLRVCQLWVCGLGGRERSHFHFSKGPLHEVLHMPPSLDLSGVCGIGPGRRRPAVGGTDAVPIAVSAQGP